MDESEKALLKQWAQTWKRAGPELERIRREELRRFRHEENIDIIGGLLEMGYAHRVPRTSSGLVEQQRRFRELWS